MTSLPDERLATIRQRLTDGGRVLAAELAREFHTSEDTIRRDLRELAAAGLCRRVYGGALSVSSASGPIGVRNVQDQARKAVLGQGAAALVQPGQIILIDAGSTNLHIARSLPAGLSVTVVTNAPAVAAELIGRVGCDLIVIGGLTGITAFDAEEAEFKRTMIARSERIIVALTNDKLSTVAPFSVAALPGVYDIVVEGDAPAGKLDGFEASGPRLHRAALSRP